MNQLGNCLRHDAYATRELAQAVLDEWKRKARAGLTAPIVGRPEVFRCKTGHHFHIGRPPGRRGGGRDRRRKR